MNWIFWISKQSDSCVSYIGHLCDDADKDDYLFFIDVDDDDNDNDDNGAIKFVKCRNFFE